MSYQDELKQLRQHLDAVEKGLKLLRSEVDGSHRLGLANRYLSAWSELEQRIAARQSVQIAYIASVGAVIAVFAASYGNHKVLAQWLALTLPCISLSFTYWFINHDINIGLLGAFLRGCEEWPTYGQTKRPSDDLKMPSWWLKYGGFSNESHNTRSIVIIAFGVHQVVALSPVIYVGVEQSTTILKGKNPSGESLPLLIISVIVFFVGLYSILKLYYCYLERCRIRNGTFDDNGNFTIEPRRN